MKIFGFKINMIFRCLVKKSGVICAALAFAVYANTIWADFVYDDTRAILQNEDVMPSSPVSNLIENDFWGTPLTHSGSHKSFRPLTTLTFKLNTVMAGGQLKPVLFHITNVLLHSVATYLFVTMAGSVWNSQFGPLLAGLLFATHPIHTEAVAGIVGRADILSAIFFLLATLSYKKHVEQREKQQKVVEEENVKMFDQNGNKLSSPEKVNNAKDKREKMEKSFFALTILCAFCSMFCKEQGITVLGVCFMTDLLNGFNQEGEEEEEDNLVKRKDCSSIVKKSANCADSTNYNKSSSSGTNHHSKKVPSLLLLILSTVFLLGLRIKVMGFSAPKFSQADNPSASSDSIVTRFLTFTYLPVFNFGLLLLPHQLSFDWSMGSIPLVKSVWDFRNLVSLVFYAILSRFLYTSVMEQLMRNDETKGIRRKRRRNVSFLPLFSLLVMILPFIPASNLLFYVGFVVAERVLYIPSMGFCLLSALAIEQTLVLMKKVPKTSGKSERKMSTRLRPVIGGALLLLLSLIFCWGFQTVSRNEDWKNEERLYRSGIEINPAKAYGNLANVLTQQGKLDESEKALKMALEHRPNMADAHYNLGVLYQGQSRLSEAAKCYKNAIRYRNKLALAHLNLGLVYASLGLKEKSLEIQTGILTIDDDGLKDPKSHAQTQISAMINIARIQLDLGRPSEALNILFKAKAWVENGTRHPNVQSIFNMLGESYQMLNKNDEAEKWYRATLRLKPDHLPAYLRYGKMLAKNKTRLNEAEQWFEKAKALAPNDPSVPLHYGLFLMDMERNLEAAHQFQLSVDISDPKQVEYDTVFNAGVAFRLSGQLDKAEMYYRKATDLRPKDSSSHMNLGAMLHLLGKLSEAEKHYLEAWRLKPGDSATKTNIQRLQRTMNKKGLKVHQIEDI